MLRINQKYLHSVSLFAIKPIHYISFLTTLLIVFQGTEFHQEDSRGVRKSVLVVSGKTKSPASYALEDLNQHRFESQSVSSEEKVLQSGKPLVLSHFPKPVQQSLMGTKKYKLKPLTITQLEPASERIIVAGQMKQEFTKKLLSANKISPVKIEATLASVESRPRQFRSWQQKLDDLIKKEMQDRGEESSEKVITSSTGSQIVVAANQKTMSAAYSKKSDERPAKSSPIQYKKIDENFGQFLLRGQIVMTGGLAFTGAETKLAVFHYDENQIQAEAEIDFETGQYAISVENFSGHLVAELYDENDKVIGSAELALDNNKSLSDAKNGEVFSLALKPNEEGLIARVVSARSFDQHVIMVDGAEVDDSLELGKVIAPKDGYVRRANITKDSSVLWNVSAAGHWDTMVLGVSNFFKKIPLFPVAMLEAFSSIVHGENLSSLADFGILWGRVVSQGKPVAKAKVELAGAHFGNPTYFSSYIPDIHKDDTGKDGYFVFSKVEKGIVSIRAKVGDELYPTRVVPIEPGKVSYVELERPSPRSVIIEAQDYHNRSKPMDIRLMVLGYENTIEFKSNEKGALRLVDRSGMTYVDLDAGLDYLMTRFSISAFQRYKKFNLFTQEWLYGVLRYKRVNLENETGVVIGLLDSNNVIVQSGGRPIDREIIYFDSTGRPLLKSEKNLASGFILYNVPFGAKTLEVADSLTGKRNVKVVYPEYNVISVENFSLRKKL